MTRSRVLIILSLCVATHCLPLGEDNAKHVATVNKYRLPDNAAPIHYDVKVNPFMYNYTFDGETRIDLEIRRSTTDIVLNSRNLTIDESQTTLETKDGRIFKPKEHVFDEDDTEMLRLPFEDTLEPGLYTLYFKFTGILSSDLYGFFHSDYQDKADNPLVLVATHFQPMSARRAFPCWDEPALKATFNISIKHHSNYTALSNMPVHSEEEIDESDGKLWTHFETTPIMSTNILAFVVADFANISNADGTTRIWVKREDIADATYFMEIVERATEELTRYLNSTVRVPKMDHVALPRYSSRATENWGLIVYRERVLLHNNKTEKINMKILNILTAAHELTHQWFGNLVSPAWWKYYWLSEGMATYLKYYVIDKIYPDWRLMDLLVMDMRYAFLSDERHDVAYINQDFGSSRDMNKRDSSIIYTKSSVILRMLSHIVSQEVFRTGLQKYIERHEYSNVTSDDLCKAMQDALDDSDVPREKFQVKKVMDSWIEQTGYPLVTVTRDYATGLTTLRQDLSPTLSDKRKRAWWIPVNYATKSDINFSSTLPTHWLRPSDENLTIAGIDPDDWIVVNVQETGYYRVNYDPLNWRKIVNYLNSDDYGKIHPINRGQIIDDAFYLMLSGRLSPIIFMKLINYLSRETDFVPWTTAFNVLSKVNFIYTHHEGVELIKTYILNLMNNYIEALGLEGRPDDTDIMIRTRTEALTWACRLGHQKCREKATTELIDHLAEPEENIIFADLEHLTYCMGLIKANQSTWDKLLESLLKHRQLDYYTISYLSCAEDPEIIKHFLNLAVTKDSPVSQNVDLEYVFFRLTDNPVAAEMELDFVIENWEKINSITPRAFDILSDIISHINKRDHFDKLKAFLASKGINKDSELHYREKAVEKIDANIAKIRSFLENEYSEYQTTIAAALSTDPTY